MVGWRCRAVLALICAAASSYLVCPAGEPTKSSRDTARAVAFGSVRGMTVPALVASQHQKALAHWKRLFSAEVPPHSESANFLVYGMVRGRDLKDIGLLLDKQFMMARK